MGRVERHGSSSYYTIYNLQRCPVRKMGSMQGAPMNGGPLVCLHLLLNVFLMANCMGGVCQTNLMFADMLWCMAT